MSETVYDGNGNVVEETIDNGDGTAIHRTFDSNGNLTLEETIQLPTPEPEPVQLVQVPKSALEELKQTAETPDADLAAALAEFASKVMGQ